MSRRGNLFCSFCGKAEDEVFTLIAGACVLICDECVGAAGVIVARKRLDAGVLLLRPNAGVHLLRPKPPDSDHQS